MKNQKKDYKCRTIMCHSDVDDNYTSLDILWGQ